MTDKKKSKYPMDIDAREGYIMQINTNTVFAHFSFAACTIANFILKKIQEHKIEHEYDDAKNAVTVDLQAIPEYKNMLKTILHDIDTEKLDSANFQNAPDYYIDYLIYLKNSISNSLEKANVLYLELNYLDVYTGKGYSL